MTGGTNVVWPLAPSSCGVGTSTTGWSGRARVRVPADPLFLRQPEPERPFSRHEHRHQHDRARSRPALPGARSHQQPDAGRYPTGVIASEVLRVRLVEYYFATERGRIGYRKLPGATLPRSSGRSLRQSGISTMPLSTGVLRPSTTPTMLPLWSTTIAGGSVSLRARHRVQRLLEKRLAEGPVITVPTITLEGDANGAPHAADPAAYAKKFTGAYQHRLITGGIGHNLPQEAPQAFAQAIIDVAKA